jgi:hypothetical protein
VGRELWVTSSPIGVEKRLVVCRQLLNHHREDLSKYEPKGRLVVKA